MWAGAGVGPFSSLIREAPGARHGLGRGAAPTVVARLALGGLREHNVRLDRDKPPIRTREIKNEGALAGAAGGGAAADDQRPGSASGAGS